MAFITGLFLIDAPASALNNGEADNIEARVKTIRVGRQEFPYASAQAYRYWLRTSLDKYFSHEWTSSPITQPKGGKQQAYTAGDPIDFADDDLFGYMRAVKEETITRVSPFRTSTLVSVAPAAIISDFGVMARVEKETGDKEGVILHQHQFYRTSLQGLFSIDLRSVGTFTNQIRSGFQNLGEESIKKATAQNLQYVPDLKAYRLPITERVRRVQVLVRAMGRIEGGAKQALHYTDITPAFVIMAVTRGGNHPFGHSIHVDSDQKPQVHAESLKQAFNSLGDDFISGVYVGRVEGFMDSSQSVLNDLGLNTFHPRQAFDMLAHDLAEHTDWFD
jgi:CRISPR-associated protein Cst2